MRPLKTQLGRGVVIALMVVGSTARAEGPVVIEKIEGSKKVYVSGPGGNRDAGPGDRVGEGDRVRATPFATVTLLYPDGTRLVVDRGSEVEVQEFVEGTQWNGVHQGSVKGLVPGTGQGKKLKFSIRSRAAVMGVRGTEFLFALSDLAGPTAEVQAISGTVEVAATETTLAAGQGVLVAAGQAVHASPAGVSAPFSFSAGETTASPAATSVSAPQLADPAISMLPELDFGLLSFQAGLLAASPDRAVAGRSEFAGPLASWNPWIGIPYAKVLALRASFGLARFPRATSGSFTVVDVAALLSCDAFAPFVAEAGTGIQSWREGGVDGTQWLLQGVLRLGSSGIDRFYVGRGFVSSAGTSVGEWRAGLGLRF